ncbi:glycoside hydrolase [Byssothecium circinans]|uniref:Glycoside hydrolase n=1 Tax=Byssothecium circinans TaxID=147558 RepID=A0A6A5TC18_9PLEO|nr:glycoside hydrolase [Byssothecium circinans]
MATGFLKVKGATIVDQNDNVVRLFGASLGGMLNMENFMNGFPATESSTRTAMLEVMGKENYEFLFERIIHHFFTVHDVQLLQSLGINSERGFKHLDRIIDLCSAHGIYVILDMHTAPGCQNPDCHSDNHTSYAAFWDFKDHQDRTVRVAAFYERLDKALRAVDPNHMLFLDGNTFAMEWKGFKGVLPNSVYSIHDYSRMGFPIGKRYVGTPEQDQKLRQQYNRKCEFHNQYGVPIWVGEFGPTYEPSGPDADQVNAERNALLGAQLAIYEKDQVSWSLWAYKDVGVMGMVSLSPETPWMKLVQPFQDRKADLQIDSFTARPTEELDTLIGQMAAWIDKVSPAAKKTYPAIWDTKQHIRRNIVQTFLATSYCGEFAELFRGKSKAELEELAKSYALHNCIQRKDLVESIARYASPQGQEVK